MLSGFPIKLPCIATQGHEVPVGAKQKARRGVLGEIFIRLSLLLFVVYLNVPFVLVFLLFRSFSNYRFDVAYPFDFFCFVVCMLCISSLVF